MHGYCYMLGNVLVSCMRRFVLWRTMKMPIRTPVESVLIGSSRTTGAVLEERSALVFQWIPSTELL